MCPRFYGIILLAAVKLTHTEHKHPLCILYEEQLSRLLSVLRFILHRSSFHYCALYKLMPSRVRVVFLSPTNLHIFWYFACGPNNHDEDNNIEGNIHNDLTTYAAEGSRCALNGLVASIVANPYCVLFWHCTMISALALQFPQNYFKFL